MEDDSMDLNTDVLILRSPWMGESNGGGRIASGTAIEQSSNRESRRERRPSNCQGDKAEETKAEGGAAKIDTRRGIDIARKTKMCFRFPCANHS
ncbi:MAG: hypothetical protein BMS9Abin15_0432 [Gammaproteobacteria bacterium]|nr:MAG: hypothetical protein BMS9Abin15_0432 [Gammaproteobacteria bacterium]